MVGADSKLSSGSLIRKSKAVLQGEKKDREPLLRKDRMMYGSEQQWLLLFQAYQLQVKHIYLKLSFALFCSLPTTTLLPHSQIRASLPNRLDKVMNGHKGTLTMDHCILIPKMESQVEQFHGYLLIEAYHNNLDNCDFAATALYNGC